MTGIYNIHCHTCREGRIVGWLLGCLVGCCLIRKMEDDVQEFVRMLMRQERWPRIKSTWEVGCLVGCRDGWLDGCDVGCWDGCPVGSIDGWLEGWLVGAGSCPDTANIESRTERKKCMIRFITLFSGKSRDICIVMILVLSMIAERSNNTLSCVQAYLRTTVETLPW